MIEAVKQAATGSWRTTLCGVLAVLAALAIELPKALDTDPATVPAWGLVATAVMAALGLTAARDNSVTSAQAGAGK